jgi:hypothetical protein
MNKSLKDTLKVTQILAPVAVTDDVATSGVAVEAGESLQLVLNVGAFAFSDTNKLSVRVQHSDIDEGTDYEAVVAADVFQDVGTNGEVKVLDSTDDASSVFTYDYKGTKKFVRLNIIEAGTVSTVLAASAIQGHLKAQGE